jgi:hypothetical protein
VSQAPERIHRSGAGTTAGAGRDPPPEEAPESRPTVALGVVVAPGLASDLTARIADDLAEDLRRSYGDVEWRTGLQVDRLVTPPASNTEILSAARRRLLESDWDLAVVVTDLPLKIGRRPLFAHTSPTHGVAIVSLPALGVFHVAKRLQRVLLRLVGELIGAPDDDRSDDPLSRLRRRIEQGALRELAADTPERGFLFVPAVLTDHVRLLVGMVRANRPWRLVARLHRALVAAVAVGALGLLDANVWLIASELDLWRLAAAGLTAIVLTIGVAIVVHGLWERAPNPRVREQVVLFNFATTATLTLGILTLYVLLFVLILSAAALVIEPAVLEHALDTPADVRDYVSLAWLVACFATVGGALGVMLESEEAVREAAYTSSGVSRRAMVEPAESPEDR